MPERRGGIYKRFDGRPNTRKANRVPRKNYVKGIPGSKIHLFEAGDPNKKFDLELSLLAEKEVQLKHNSLEAARIAVNKTMSSAGITYFLKIRVYPHHILRENPLATGAGADRFSSGMSKAFGKPIGKAARVKKMQKILSVRVNADKQEFAKDALRKAKMKFPVKCRVIVDELRKEEKEETKKVEKKVLNKNLKT